MADEDPVGKAGRDRIRLTSRWRAEQHIVETAEGELHVATTSAGALAEHIAELHNRTLGDGQDPATGDEFKAALANAGQDFAEQVPGADRALRYLEARAGRALRGADGLRRAYLAGYADRSKEVAETVNTMRPPRADDERTPRRAFLDAANASGYLDTIGEIVEDEVRRRVADHAAREPARISLVESADAMVWALRQLGYRITEPAVGFFSCGATGADHEHPTYNEAIGCMTVRGDGKPSPPVIEMPASGDNGRRLIIDGVEEVHVNDGDPGAAGLVLGVRALCRKLGLEVIEP